MYGIIYMIRNKKNNKIYFGQTIRRFEERYFGGIQNTNNMHLKSSIKKYGIENFEIDKEFDIAYSKEELDGLEDMYIKIYKTTNPKYGYNKKFGGSNGSPTEETKRKMSEVAKGENSHWYGKCGELSHNYGRKHSEETKEKIRKTKKENYNKNKENTIKKVDKNKEKKKVICLNNLKIFDNMTLASKYYNCRISHISSCCNKKRDTCGIDPKTGYKLQWMFLEDYNREKDNLSIILYKYKKSKPIRCKTTMMVFNSTKDAGEFYNINPSSITQCLKGRTSHCGRNPETEELLKWEYVELERFENGE